MKFRTITIHYKDDEAYKSKIRENFNEIDEDGGGSLDKHEIGDLMNSLGVKVTSLSGFFTGNHPKLNALWEELDEDGDGEIEFDEFYDFIQRKDALEGRGLGNGGTLIDFLTKQGYGAAKGKQALKNMKAYLKRKLGRDDGVEDVLDEYDDSSGSGDDAMRKVGFRTIGTI